MPKNTDELETSDYKLSKSGKKIKAHRIVFNKGEEDNTKLREDSMTDDQKSERERIVKGMKKNYKGFVAKYGKDRAKSVMYATATKTAMKEETVIDEAHPFDIPKSGSGMASGTRTKHDVKKTTTGTVYTKQRDADGNSKEFKRDPDQTKRGRGRPKKNSFSEAAEFLMSLDEETFNELMAEGFDSFAKQFEQLDELSKTALGNYVKRLTK